MMEETYVGIIILDNDATVPVNCKAVTDTEAKEKIEKFWINTEGGRPIKDIVIASAEFGSYVIK
jgi:hypothetical protein